MALAAAEVVPQTAVSLGNDVLSATGAGFPNSFSRTCIKTSFEFAQAFRKGEQRCVSPCLFGRFVDTNADPVRCFLSSSLFSLSLLSLNLVFPLFLRLLPPPFHSLCLFAPRKKKHIKNYNTKKKKKKIWRAGSPLPPKNASEFMKGERVTLAFVVPSSGLEGFLKASAENTGGTAGLTAAILDFLGIGADDIGVAPGDRIPVKIFGDDCSLFERTNPRVRVSYPTFPDAFDRVTRDFKLDPNVLGEDALRPLQLAYSYGGASVPAQFKSATGCNVNVNGTDAPDCDSAVNKGAASIPAGSGPGCADYVAALQAFCTPGGTQNYDSGSCVATVKRLAAKNPGGQATAIQARAMFAACYDFLAGFNTDNAMITAGAGKLAGREYLVTGDGLLAQAGGYFIEWLTVA